MKESSVKTFVISTKLVVLFFLILTISIAFGEGFGFASSENMRIPLDLVFALIWAGLLAGFFKWPLLGGISSTAGILLFILLSGGVFADWFVWTMLIPAAMCIVCWWMKRPYGIGKTTGV